MYCLGIDLGTTNSCIAKYNADTDSANAIESKSGQRITPSFVAIDDYTFCVGDDARKLMKVNPKIVYDKAKRFIGRRRGNLPKTNVSYQILCDQNNDIVFGVTGETKPKRITPQQVSAFVIEKLIDDARAKDRNFQPPKVAIAVPANFNDHQRKATVSAGKIAGVDVVGVVSEPTAAALYYATKKPTDGPKNILVFDFGGGTLDVTVMNVNGNKYKVIATSGNPDLGGCDIDAQLCTHFIAKILSQDESIDLDASKYQKNKALLNMLCEETKIYLSGPSSQGKKITFDVNGKSFDLQISLVEFEEIILEPILNSMEKTIKEAMNRIRRKNVVLDSVVMVGGSSSIPAVRRRVEEITNAAVAPLNDINPEEAVACGAAIYAAIKSGTKAVPIEIVDVIPMAIGIGHSYVHVSQGIKKNARRPATSDWQIYKTVRNDQDTIDIKIFEGDSMQQSECFLVAEFSFSGIPKGEAGSQKVYQQIRVTEDEITLFATLDNPFETEEPTNVKEMTKNVYSDGTLSQDEIEQKQRDNGRFKEMNPAPPPPIELFKDFVNSQKGQIMQIRNLTERKKAQTLNSKTLEWARNNPNATQGEINDKQFEYTEAARNIQNFNIK